MKSLSIETTVHGRVLVEEVTKPPAEGFLVVFHGYGQSADEALADTRRIVGVDRWTIVALQALHRFYSRNDERVIASWMTRQDRDEAIRDNVAYVDRVLEVVGAVPPLVFAGFSQGASMAYRAAMLGRHRAAGVIALGGDIPPELKSAAQLLWPPILIGAGLGDTWYTGAKVEADVAFLAHHHVAHDVVRFRGGHEWTDQFRETASQWLQARSKNVR